MARYRNRKKKKEPSNWGNYVLYTLLGLVIVIIGYSLIIRETPIYVVKSTIQKVFNGGDSTELGIKSKRELIAIIAQQDSTITQQKEQLARLTANLSQLAYIDVESQFLNMRDSAAISSNILIRIPHKSQVEVIYCDDKVLYIDGESGNWCKIKYAEQEGWVWGNYLSQEMPMAELQEL